MHTKLTCNYHLHVVFIIWYVTITYIKITSISALKVEETTERIDLEKLKKREKIMFYEDMTLFEDELADNGTSILSVKIVSYF